jgi:ubiquinone/menaquinone biosynthesis C-methylase UbiE
MARHAAQVTACDLAPRMLEAITTEAARRGFANIVTHAAAAEALPFADDTFDFLACRFSTHHWRNAEAGLREARRVLAPGAPALFMDVIAPADPAADTHLQAVELLRDGSHVRDYRTCEWGAKLKNAGFAHQVSSEWKLTMRFGEWVARMRTPELRVQAIRSLFDSAPDEARAYFNVQEDYTFDIDAAMFDAVRMEQEIY